MNERCCGEGDLSTCLPPCFHASAKAQVSKQHGGLTFLDHLEKSSTNPMLLRAIAEVRAEIETEEDR